MFKFVLFAFALLTATSAQAELQSPDYCIQKYTMDTDLPVSTDIIFAGTQITVDNWTVDHDNITIKFDDLDLTFYYDHDSVDNIAVLMDWIGTALREEAEDGYATLAVLDREQNVVRLLSQSVFEDRLICFGNLLPIPEDINS
jgi:hypothetical protein